MLKTGTNTILNESAKYKPGIHIANHLHVKERYTNLLSLPQYGTGPMCVGGGNRSR